MVAAWHDQIRKNTGVDVSGDADPCRLWVPMQLQALVFGTRGTASFLDLTPYYDGLPTEPYAAPLGHQLRRELFNPVNPPEAGVHLHWMLPAAFTHLRPAGADNGSPPELPLVPNRWMVVRLWEAGSRLQYKSWVIESDFKDPVQGVSPWLEKKGSAYEITRLGRTQPLENWAPPQATETLLSAFAPGNLAFAGFYPSCRGVFGFYDEAADLVEGTVYSYLVAGWFADKLADPLNVRQPRLEEEQEEARLQKKLTDKERWLRRMGQLHWAIPGDSSILPTALTCYGIMFHIQWTVAKRCDSLVRPTVTAAIGNSVTEAAAALAARTGDSQRLLSELQYATLAEQRPSYTEAKDENFIKNLSLLTRARAKLHERAFSPRDGGLSWEIALQQDNTRGEEANAQPLPQLTEEIAGKLCELNRRQREYDEIRRTLMGWQRRLFAAWYQHQYWNSSAAPTLTAERQNQLNALLLQQITICKENVDALLRDRETDVGAKRAALKTATTDLKTALDKHMPKASLIGRAMPQFWRANDPFVVMEGLPVPTMQGGASPLQCRVSNNPIASIELEKVPIIGTILIKRDDLMGKPNWCNSKPWNESVPPTGIPADIKELLFDALLIDPDRAEFLTRLYLRPQYGEGPPTDRLANGKTAIAEALSDIKKAVAGNTLKIEGVQASALDCLISAINLPSPTSWRPVFMRWRLDWHPYCQEKDLTAAANATVTPMSSRSTAHWDFTWHESGRVDYQWQRPQPPNDRKANSLDGFTVIAANIERGLQLTSNNFPEYASVFRRMIRPLLGQSLMGLTEALGMQDIGPQLPPLKGPGDLSVDDDIAGRVGHQYASAPLNRLNDPVGGSPFSPLRGGLFSLSHLSIVDSFGRVMIIHDKDSAANPPKLGRGLRGQPPDDGFAVLPPRLVQPARLLLRWLSAWSDDQESLGGLETNPICGFIIHNRLDGSLLIYGTSNEKHVIYGTGSDGQPRVGRLLGAVQTVQYLEGSGPVRWSTLPMRPFTGTPATLESRVLTDADIPNPHLRNFVNGLLKLRGGALGTAFQTFLDLLERREEASELPVDQSLQSVLTGRPLALVRASLRLELDGPPLRDETAVPSGETAAYLSVQFPVRLGDRRFGSDGLIGYFVDDRTGTAYDQLRLAADEKSYQRDATHGYFHDQRDLEVACDPDAEPIKLTLLMDPKPGVHVVSGILPVNRVDLPQPLVAATLSDLEIPFLVAPFLGEQVADPSSVRRMPLPTNGHNEWTWEFFDNEQEEPHKAEVRVETESAPSLSVPMALHEGWLNYHPSRAKPTRAKQDGGNQ